MSAAATPVSRCPPSLAVPLPVAPYTVSLSAVAAVCLVCLGAVAFGVRAVAAFGPSGSGQPIHWPSARRRP